MNKQPLQPCRGCGRVLRMKRNSDICHTCRVKARPAEPRICRRCAETFTTRDQRDLCWSCLAATRPERDRQRAVKEKAKKAFRASESVGDTAKLMKEKPRGELYNR